MKAVNNLEVLHTYQEMSSFGSSMVATAIFVCICTGLIGLGLTFIDKKYKIGIPLICIFLITALTTFYFYNDLPRDTYHVISAKDVEKVNFEEYEIIKQEGLMITVIER